MIECALVATDIENLSELIVGEFARVHTRFDNLESRIGTQLSDISNDLRDIRTRAEALEEAVSNISGFSKEIDHLLQRVATIEKHLGLQTAIDA